MEVAFKKKPKKAAAARKRSRRADADADAEEEQADEKIDTLRVLEEVREDQRLRAQVLKQELASRVASEAAAAPGAKSGGKAAPAADSGEYGLHDPKKDGSAGQKLLSLLDGQFTGQSSTTQKDQHEELLEKYIEEKLHKKRVEGDEAEAAPAVSEEDALFALPDHLNPKKQQQAAAGGEEDDESASGGVLIWNTGIAEVELPESFAHKTAQATERALRLQEEARAARGRRHVDSSALPANFSTDFNRHRSDFVAELKTMRKDDQRERGFRKLGKNQPGDDAAVSRFRKFESRRMRR